jgi:hypothetical protein
MGEAMGKNDDHRHHPPPARAYKKVYPVSWLVTIVLLIVAGAMVAFLIR